jgi:hypothetical protein
LRIQTLDLHDIVVFALVVEAGSFTAAARVLGVPKTTVSRRIAALREDDKVIEPELRARVSFSCARPSAPREGFRW